MKVLNAIGIMLLSWVMILITGWEVIKYDTTWSIGLWFIATIIGTCIPSRKK